MSSQRMGLGFFYDNIKEVATGLQDFLICIEMFLAAIAHYYSFSHRPYMDMAADHGNCCESFVTMWDVRDVRDDVIDHARYISHSVKKTLSRNKLSTTSTECTPLLASPDSSVMSNPDRSSIQLVMEPRLQVPGHHEAISTSEADWERSMETFHIKSGTPSLNNYVDFTTSTDIPTPHSQDQRGDTDVPDSTAGNRDTQLQKTAPCPAYLNSSGAVIPTDDSLQQEYDTSDMNSVTT